MHLNKSTAAAAFSWPHVRIATSRGDGSSSRTIAAAIAGRVRFMHGWPRNMTIHPCDDRTTEVCNNPNARQGMGGALLRTASRGWKVEKKVHFLTDRQESQQDKIF